MSIERTEIGVWVLVDDSRKSKRKPAKRVKSVDATPELKPVSDVVQPGEGI